MSRAWIGLFVATAIAIAAGVLLSAAPSKPPLPRNPGADAITLPTDLQATLAAKTAARMKSGYQPRTKHLLPDGRPKYTNRLIDSASTYLQQHAHNPVNWFPWGEEAFELAEELGRPIFLSVGYATCHWCHVMEEESFEDEEIAAYLNANYIAIKVDREARPDIDRIYMTAVQVIHRRGGWPMSLWLKPDREPIFAATYIPARTGDRGSRKGFLTFLEEIATTWREDPSEIEEIAARLTKAVQQNMAPTPNSGVPSAKVFDLSIEQAQGRYDYTHGGRSGKPKFPSNLPLRVLLSAATAGDSDARTMALHTLDKMAAGGLYDQVGGGFHRYTVDEAWQVPHFEKMLYDNALLARIYGEAFQLTGDLRYAAVVDETLSFMHRDLGADGGGFASALDADSLGPDGEREEGWFYTWTPDELTAVLGEQAAPFIEAYGVTPAGNFEGRNILHFPEPPSLDVRRRWTKARLSLQLERRKRPPPLRDEKVLTAWNGLAIDALAYNGWLFARSDWIDEARSTAELLLEGRKDGRLARMRSVDGPEGTAFLDDYAFLIRGLLSLFEATGEPRWLQEAIALEATAAQHYADTSGAWFRTPADHEALLVRDKPDSDQAVPSANTVMIENELRLAALTSDDRYRATADQIASGLPIEGSPSAYSTAVLALQGRHIPLEEVVLVTAEGQRASDLKAAVKRAHPSWRVLIQATEGDTALAAVAPPAVDKVQLDGKPTAYVCRGGVCDRPTTDPAVLAELITRRARKDQTPSP